MCVKQRSYLIVPKQSLKRDEMNSHTNSENSICLNLEKQK